MKKLKRILSILATTLIAAAFAGCGTYTPPENTDDPDKPGSDTPIVNPGPENPAEDVFKVSLVWNGNPFTQANYAGLTGIQAQWTDLETNEVFRAAFDKDGVAKSPDLDGDYRVTLVSLPDGYTYEPNIYEANNDFKEVTIALYKITPVSRRGPYRGEPFVGEYYYDLTSIGAYRVTLEKDQKVFFRFQPSVNGKYTVTSMVDVTANEINPLLDLHFGSTQYIAPMPAKTQDDGGSENSYTKNFRMEYTITPDEVGNLMIFRLYSTCRNDSEDSYPLVVDFILDRDGDFASRYDAAEEIRPTHNFDAVSSSILNPAGTFVYCANRPGVENKKLDQREVKLYDDGYYYYYDSLTGTRLERVYAQLIRRTEVMDESFYSGPHVTLYYLVGADGVAKNYEQFIRGENGYGAHCNGDGVYPVNEELKEFLQTYSVCQRFFNDGNGWAETEAKYNSDEDSQWMFACGYYAT